MRLQSTTLIKNAVHFASSIEIAISRHFVVGYLHAVPYSFVHLISITVHYNTNVFLRYIKHFLEVFEFDTGPFQACGLWAP